MNASFQACGAVVAARECGAAGSAGRPERLPMASAAAAAAIRFHDTG
jgi:hypothetical protein